MSSVSRQKSFCNKTQKKMAIDNRQLRELMERLKTDERFLPRYQAYRQVNREKAWQTFCRRTGIPLRRRLVMRRVLQYAAVVLIALGTGLYFLNRPAEEQPTLAISAPPEGKAVLTLADGRTVSLDEASDSLSLPQVRLPAIGRPGSRAAIQHTGDGQGRRVSHRAARRHTGTPERILAPDLSAGFRG